MFKKYCVILFFSCLFIAHAYASTEYAIATLPTPVLDTADFKSVFGGGQSGSQLHQDESGLIREVEFIALPGTVFKID